MADNIDPAKKAAIVAAIAALMAEQPKTAMFIRSRKDSGPWDRSSRIPKR